MLSVEQLDASYGPVTVLQDVAITIAKGSLVSIVGANCAGKSTLINAISGLLKPSSGRIVLDGVDITEASTDERVSRGIVQVPEGRKLFPQMTVEENLLLGASVPRAVATRGATIDYVMDMFPRLRERRGQIASTLSGGEQQMVAIARALMAQPKLLMLDEPSLGLAPVIVEELFGLLEELNAGGLTMLLVEQNVEDSLSVCDFGYVLEGGRIVLAGTRDELLSNTYLKEAYLGLEADAASLDPSES